MSALDDILHSAEVDRKTYVTARTELATLRSALAASQAREAELQARIDKVLGWCATGPYVYHVDLEAALKEPAHAPRS